MDTSVKIQIAINTLNLVTVSGKKNLDYLLGSIQTLEQIKRELEEKTDDKQTDSN